MDEEKLEAIVRRVIREELHRYHAGGIRPPKVVEAPRRGAISSDEKGMQNLQTPGGAQSVTVVSEPGLYEAIFRIRVTAAQDFKRW